MDIYKKQRKADAILSDEILENCKWLFNKGKSEEWLHQKTTWGYINIDMYTIYWHYCIQ